MEATENYWLDNYGTCEVGASACTCLKRKWLGQGCINWTPLGVKSFEEYAAHIRATKTPRKVPV